MTQHSQAADSVIAMAGDCVKLYGGLKRALQLVAEEEDVIVQRADAGMCGNGCRERVR